MADVGCVRVSLQIFPQAQLGESIVYFVRLRLQQTGSSDGGEYFPRAQVEYKSFLRFDEDSHNRPIQHCVVGTDISKNVDPPVRLACSLVYEGNQLKSWFSNVMTKGISVSTQRAPSSVTVGKNFQRLIALRTPS